MNILRACGMASIGTRLAFINVERRNLDRDRNKDKIERDPNSGLDRVRTIFDRREDGSISPELASVNMVGFTGMFIGAIIGGIFYAKAANVNFRESNEATLFDSNLDAKRKLQNESTVGFGKGAFRMGWRVGIFCWLFYGVSTVVSVFRNKTSVTDFSIAGMATGALFKTNMGLKGMISGGFFGTLFGTFGGIMMVSLLKLSGVSMQGIRIKQAQITYAKDDAFHWAVKKQMSEPDIIMENFPQSPATKDFSYEFLSDLDDIDEQQSPNESAKDTKTPTNVAPTNK